MNNKLSAKERARLKKLAARPDEEIDTSDIPELQQIPPGAVMGKFYRPVKQAVTIRIDSDVLAWLKSQGEGYQTRINGYLREMLNAARRQTRS